jgi:hypothetical protein
MRTYALADESALLICSWPHGDRPKVPFPYFTEVMTGFEYQAAAHMIYEGLVDEGLTVVEAIRRRFDGERRNPWNEQECGHHYARAMAAWAVPLALSGFHYSAVSKQLTLAPRWNPESFQSFWITAGGWGTVSQKIDDSQQQIRWDVLSGALEAQTLRCMLPPGLTLQGATVRLDDEALAHSLELADQPENAGGQSITLRLNNAAKLLPGRFLGIELVLS